MRKPTASPGLYVSAYITTLVKMKERTAAVEVADHPRENT